MIKKIFKATIALLLAVNVVAGVGADTVKAGNFTFSGEFVRVFYKGEELYMPIRDFTYDEYYFEYVDADYGILQNMNGGYKLYHYNTAEQINANNDTGVTICYGGEDAYIYGVDPTTHKIMDGAVIYSADMSAVSNFKGEDRAERPLKKIDNCNFAEEISYSLSY